MVVTTPVVVIRPDRVRAVREPHVAVGPGGASPDTSEWSGSVKDEMTPDGEIRPMRVVVLAEPHVAENRARPGDRSPAACPAAAKFETTPAGVRRPIEPVPSFTNHWLPSAPVAMSTGVLMPLPAKEVAVPAGVIRPMVPASEVNHTLPSGPAPTSCRSAMPGPVKAAITPVVVMRPIDELAFATQRLPSGPAVIDVGVAIPGPVNDVSVPLGVRRVDEVVSAAHEP